MLAHALVSAEVTDGLPPLSAAGAASDLSIDAQFIVMLEAFRPHGGLARLCELPPRSSAEAMLLDPAVLHFDWSGQTWVPMFQFEPASRTVRAGVGLVVAALRPTHDGWQICTWFTRRCALLGGATPVDRLAETQQAVLEAAQHASRLRMN